nr:MAG TPA: hypothetical protein [Caudoviricetes sp.]
MQIKSCNRIILTRHIVQFAIYLLFCIMIGCYIRINLIYTLLY